MPDEGALPLNLAAIQSALHRALAVARLGPKAPAPEREQARGTLSLLALIRGEGTRLIVLQRCTPNPRTGELTSWAAICRDTGITEAEAQAHYMRGLNRIARAVAAG